MDATTNRQRWKWTPERLLEFQSYFNAAHAANPGDDFGTIAKRWLETLPAQCRPSRLLGPSQVAGFKLPVGFKKGGGGRRKKASKATKVEAAAAAVQCEGATGGDAVTLEAALDALVAAIVARVETKLAARLASVQVGGRSEKTVGGVKPVGVRSMSDQQLRDRIGLARARGDHGEVKSCVNELKRRDGIANRFATANNGAED